ncbi:MAG: response regulator [Leptolyngbyaceae bacterium]|nr:response regulator [Leptolyngbyaceae bacterium]
MQGNLNEIDIRSILQLIELGQRTGELLVEAYSFQGGPVSSPNVAYFKPMRSSRRLAERSWFIFFLNGQIIYAAESNGGLSRLRDHLRRYQVEVAIDTVKGAEIASINAPEYGYLWALLENHILTPAQGRSIIQGMVQETLFDLLNLRQGLFIFEGGSALTPQLTTLEIGSLVAKIIKQVQEWKQFYPHIQSPDQCPAIADLEHLQQTLPTDIFTQLARWMDGKTSIRQIARYRNRDILVVARALYPYIQQGSVQLLYATPDETNLGTGEKPNRTSDLQQEQKAKAPRIMCIDDGVTIRKAVESILSHHGYEATAIENPLQAMSLVFQFHPDLILCDIAMPDLDGYEICAMLRQSSAFRQTPIVMLTGKDGFIDRVKARMAGATDYLTKPFGASELLMLVEKYIGPGNPDDSISDGLFIDTLKDVDTLKDELEGDMTENRVETSPSTLESEPIPPAPP